MSKIVEIEAMKNTKVFSPFVIALVFFTFNAFSFSTVNLAFAYKITRSIGFPWNGRLENGVPFPRMFSGYILRSKEHTYTTPELIGALLDAIQGVRRDFPDTCDLYIGDFSKPRGGPWYPKHRSHQNGRDVDLGMYAKGNRQLHSFIPMNRTNLDVSKTWCLIKNLLATGMVEKIFVDKSIQKLLYKYALSQGYDRQYLDRLFYNVRHRYSHAIIRHVRGHRDHMHVRFHAPWSELAGRHLRLSDKEMRVIALAQQNFLPKRVLVYVDDPTPLEDFSRQLGVSPKDLKRWNNLNNLDNVYPGMAIVFYRKNFEVDAMKVAMTLNTDLFNSPISSELALLHKNVVLGILPPKNSETVVVKRVVRWKIPKARLYRVRKGDTLYGIARRFGISVSMLMKDNKISPTKPIIKPGQILKIRKFHHRRSTAITRAKVYKIKPGDTLWHIARRFNTHVAKIMRLNGLRHNSILKPGMTLRIPQ